MNPLRFLGFGSSARGGAAGWTDVARVRHVIATLRPTVVIDGASPAGGADNLVHEVAVALGIRAVRCPVVRDLDGPWPAAGHRRNARMYRDSKPHLAAGFISGKVGSALSSGSAGMARICSGKIPMVIFREDGVEPIRVNGAPCVAAALAHLRALYALTRDAALVPPGRALASLAECGDPSPAEVVDGLLYAADGSRWAAWIEPVVETVRA